MGGRDGYGEESRDNNDKDVRERECVERGLFRTLVDFFNLKA